MRPTRLLSTLIVAGACAGAAAAGAAPPTAAGEPVQKLRVVGGLAGVHQYTRHEEPFWSQGLARASKGRLSADIVPFDRAGILPQEMLRLVRLGVVPFGTALLASSGADDPELLGPDLAGLNPDPASLRRTVEAARPRLKALLAERHGIELLALYSYPAQVLFCRAALDGLEALAGRRVRVSGPSQADFVTALGATPVQTPFSEIVPNVASGNVDCAITGTMGGNSIGLHEVTSHVHAMPLGWGLSAFVANGRAWRQLGAATQALLRTEIAQLERAIWNESAGETREGIACNTGAPGCASGHPGHMVEVRETPADAQLRRHVLLKAVVPAWIRRCGASCATLWRESLGPASGLAERP